MNQSNYTLKTHKKAFPEKVILIFLITSLFLSQAFCADVEPVSDAQSGTTYAKHADSMPEFVVSGPSSSRNKTNLAPAPILKVIEKNSCSPRQNVSQYIQKINNKRPISFKKRQAFEINIDDVTVGVDSNPKHGVAIFIKNDSGEPFCIHPEEIVIETPTQRIRPQLLVRHGVFGFLASSAERHSSKVSAGRTEAFMLSYDNCAITYKSCKSGRCQIAGTVSGSASICSVKIDEKIVSVSVKGFKLPREGKITKRVSMKSEEYSQYNEMKPQKMGKNEFKNITKNGDKRDKPSNLQPYSAKTKEVLKSDSLSPKIDELAKRDYQERYSNNVTPKVYANSDIESHVMKPAATITNVEARSSVIETSLSAAAKRSGIPDEILKKFANLFSVDVDTDVSDLKGSRFNVIYEVYRNNGQSLKTGNLLAAEFIHNGIHYQSIWFKNKSGYTGYYDVEGKPLKDSYRGILTESDKKRFMQVLYRMQSYFSELNYQNYNKEQKNL